MKKFLLIFCLLFISYSFAQNDTISNKNQLELKYYFGFGLVALDDYNLSSRLEGDGFPDIKTEMFDVSFGISLQSKRSMYTFEIGVTRSEDDRNANEYELTRQNYSLDYQYNLFNIKQHKINLGGRLSLNITENELFNANSEADLENPSNLGELTKIDLTNWYLGPVVSFQFTNKTNDPWLRLQLSYEFNISENSWKSDYTQLLNSVKEDQNQLRVQAIFPFF